MFEKTIEVGTEQQKLLRRTRGDTFDDEEHADC